MESSEIEEFALCFGRNFVNFADFADFASFEAHANSEGFVNSKEFVLAGWRWFGPASPFSRLDCSFETVFGNFGVRLELPNFGPPGFVGRSFVALVGLGLLEDVGFRLNFGSSNFGSNSGLNSGLSPCLDDTQ